MPIPTGALGRHHIRRVGALVIAVLLGVSGCTSLRQWHRNGWKVGPNYVEPAAPTSAAYTPNDPRVTPTTPDAAWWTAFNDPVLDSLIARAHEQSPDLERAEAKVLEARAQKRIAVGNLLPQSQQDLFAYVHGALSDNLADGQGGFNDKFNIWAQGAYATWELDIWGRQRRTIEGTRADVSAACYGYEEVLVALLADTAAAYFRIRAYQTRLELMRKNVELQQETTRLVQARFDKGLVSAADLEQAKANQAETESQVPVLENGLRQANNCLCVLLGMPPHDLTAELTPAPVPAAPPSVAVGIPADLLRRRPDVRRVERELASQCAKIGMAEADLYPNLSLIGFLGWTASDFRRLFDGTSFTGIVAPNISWKLLNYGRILNAVRTEEFRFQQKLFEYQSTVLKAGQEVEDSLSGFLTTTRQIELLERSLEGNRKVYNLALQQYQAGTTDFDRVVNTQLKVIRQQDELVQARLNSALELVKVYKAVGGGWEHFHAVEGLIQRRCRPTQLSAIPATNGAVQPVAVPAP
jgi:NodT family efflux transporter outer membrane factor (OMF) lipoprotein